MAPSGRRRILRPPRWQLALAAAGALLLLYAVVEWIRLPDAAEFRSKNPRSTALMEARAEEARTAGRKPKVRQRWVPVSAISLTAIEAVLVSEDDAFFQHQGLDTKQVELVVREAWTKGKLTRGASTLTQQLAKNLWLSTDRSLLRKLKELILARRLEREVGKDRILELYLNVVEWGEGVYGIEAAAREHFGKSASQLTPGEGAILAAMLPSPRKWLPAKRPAILRTRALAIIDRLQRYRRLSATAAASARIAIENGVGTPKAPEPEVAPDATQTGESLEPGAEPVVTPSLPTDPDVGAAAATTGSDAGA